MLSGDALDGAQSTLLTSLANTNMSANTEGAATLVLAVVTAVPGAVLSPATQASALTVLAAVASAPQNMSSSSAQTITSALSAVATSAAATGGSSTSVLSQVHDVLASLTTTTAASLTSQQMVPGASLSTTTTSPQIQMRVQLDPPGSDRLTSQSISAPGSPSAFEPMPAGLLDPSQSVVTSFFSLAFDPYPVPAGSGMATTGLTRLAFSNPDGSPIVVENATVPIRFSLPAVDTSAGNQAICAFWDTATSAYSTRGCAGVPSPIPPGHVVSFWPNFTATTDAQMALAWNISGPMTDDGSCFVALLDCGSAVPGPHFWDASTSQVVLSHLPGIVFPDPSDPLGTPSVSCPNASLPQRPLRVYWGTDCQLWRPDNAYNCSWDNVLQSFTGGGCMQSAGPQQCMCRHLTDFASARAPKIATCSLADMTSFSAADIVTKLKFLFIVVMVLFGFMQVGAVVALLTDMNDQRSTLKRLQAPDAGFCELSDGTWVWRFEQEPLRSPVQAPSGSAVVLAGVFGLPFIRLRAALPEALIAGTVGQALGRQAGLSAHGLAEARDENFAALSELVKSMSCFGPHGLSRIPALEFGGGEHGTTPQAHPPKESHIGRDSAWRVRGGPSQRETALPSSPKELAAELVGTAMVLAFMSNAKTLKVVELARRLSDARTRFRGVSLVGVDHDFEALHAMFLVMLSPGNLSNRGDWLEISRLWRFILLQQSDGGWSPSQSLAFALQAHEGARPPPPPPRNIFRKVLGALLGDDDLDDALDDAIEDVMTSSDDEDEDDVKARDAAAKASTVKILDCPLTFSATAIRRRLPPALATLNAQTPEQKGLETKSGRRLELDDAAQAQERAEQEAQSARARRLETLQMELATSHPAARAASSKRLAMAAADAAEHLHRAPMVHLLNENAPALLSVIDKAITALRNEVEALRTMLAYPTEPMDERRVARLTAAERSASRRLDRVISLRVTVPPRREALPVPAPVTEDVTPSSKTGGTSVPMSILRHRLRLRPPLQVDRIWATILSLEVLEELECCWLVDDEAEVVRTIVDAGRAFLHAQARGDKRLRPLVKRHGLLEKAADRARKDWKAIQAFNVAQLRDAEVINKFTALTHLQRASARVVHSLFTGHSTFSVFLDSDGYLMRWQRLMILVTLVLSTLLTSIWFYYSRGANCCAELRMILDCDPVGPCRGYTADCSDLQAQFADVQGPYMYSDGPGLPPTEHMYVDSWVCHAFPDDAYTTDQFFVGLISVAVALPVDLFLVRAFEIANEGEMPGNWVNLPPGRWRMLLGKDMHNGWALADQRHPISDFVMHLILVGDDWWEMLKFAALVAANRLRQLLRRARGAPSFDPASPGDGASPRSATGSPHSGGFTPTRSNSRASSADRSAAAARADALKKRLYASAGLFGVYLCWTIFAWCVVRRCQTRLSLRNCRHPHASSFHVGSSSRTACSYIASWATRHSKSLRRRALDRSVMFRCAAL